MKISPYVLLLSFVVALVVALGIVAAKFSDTVSRFFGQPGPTGPSPSRLAAYGIDIRQSSVSGVSSGGAMAIQMHVAHSAIMQGVGVIAGVGYDCADSRQPDVSLRLFRGLACMEGADDTNAPFSIARTTEAAAVPGAIDPTSNLGRQKVWLFSGYNDGTVRRAAMNAVAAYYDHYANPGNVFYQIDNRAPHALVTDDYGGPCLGFNDQYINNCAYDAAGNLLKHIYGRLNPRSNNPAGSVLAFDQREFAAGVSPNSIGLADTGYVYVPPACSSRTCRVHVVFHGCRQYADNPQVNKAVVEHGGYNRWADGNNFIMLYPQAAPIPTTLGDPGNPRGCWDWWGYSKLPRSSDFARKSGYQIAAVKAMIDRLAESFVPASPSGTFAPPENALVADATSNSLVLIWQPNSAVAGVSIGRSPSATGPFVPIASLVKGASFVDTGLARNTVYHYELRAIDAANTTSPPVRLSGSTPATAPPACEPYFSDNRTHINSLRAYQDFLGEAHAFGSNDDMGRARDDVFTQLTKEPGPALFFRVRYCP